ncbi:MAG: ABC transporter ATP-binding protein [Sneathiella sp.]
MFELKNISKKVGDSYHIRDVSMRMEKGSLNVLLGPTLSGKTTLMRLMAGLDKPTEGDIIFDGQSVLGVPVQKRKVAMVYQQFINYPAMTVYDNIASPMRLSGLSKDVIDAKVRKAAELMKLSDYLDRTPLHLSGGQQQRTALARALVKEAGLVLLDEPLANLDYKLREELRVELPKLFAETGAVFVYATTEPHEALLLGGSTATMCEGRLTQFGKSISVHNKPVDLSTAQIFSDPPMNILSVVKKDAQIEAVGEQMACPSNLQSLTDGDYTVGIRPHHMYLTKPEGDCLTINAKVTTTEITGSESFIHIETNDYQWVALTHGVHRVEIQDTVPVYLKPEDFFFFNGEEKLIAAPARLQEVHT